MKQNLCDKNWFMEIRYNELAKFNMLCFPWGGGNASSFLIWKMLPYNLVNIWALKMPGRESRIDDKLIYCSSELIKLIINALPLSSEIPLIFYGHSLGAGLAYQTIIELNHRQLLLPKLFIASGRMPPHYSNSNPIANMNNIEIINYVKTLGGVGAEIPHTDEFLKYYLPKIKADYKINSTIPNFEAHPLPICIKIINGKDDPLIKGDKLSEWSLHTCHPLESFILPGGHFFMNEGFKEFINLIEKQIRGLSIDES